MTLIESAHRLYETLKHVQNLDETLTQDLIKTLDALNTTLSQCVQHDLPKKISRKEHKCLKCNQTDPSMFNRKKTECVPCMSKSSYEKIKDTINIGKERNIVARISRIKCSNCELKVTREKDHRNPEDKSYAISRMNRRSDELFYAEIAKCDILCRNCHIMRTQRQFAANEIPKRQTKDVVNGLK